MRRARILIPIAAGLALLSGCNPTIDSSDARTFQRSVQRMSDALSEERPAISAAAVTHWARWVWRIPAPALFSAMGGMGWSAFHKHGQPILRRLQPQPHSRRPARGALLLTSHWPSDSPTLKPGSESRRRKVLLSPPLCRRAASTVRRALAVRQAWRYTTVAK
jgi:hypothetical protein